MRVYEFENGQTKLAAELTEAEMTWSRSTPVAYDQVKAWFGEAIKGEAPAGEGKPANMSSTQMKFVWWILGLNAIPLLFNFGGSFWLILIALFALYWPAGYFQGEGDKK